MPRQDAVKWKPDTCECEFYIKVDGEGNIIYLDHDAVKAEHAARIAARDPAANPSMSGTSEPVKVCPAHTAMGLGPGQSLANLVSDECRRKNLTWGLIQKEFNLGDADRDKYICFFDSARDLHISLIGMTLTSGQRAKLQADLNNQFGKDRVRVV